MSSRILLISKFVIPALLIITLFYATVWSVIRVLTIILKTERVIAMVEMIKNVYSKALTMENLNPQIVKMDAVCGPIEIRATEIQKEIDRREPKPFARVIAANLGDPHAMQQVPITFIRQVLALCMYPIMIEKGDMPVDAKQKARDLLDACGGHSVGAYTSAQGIELIRRHVAEYIERRDGYPARWEDIVLFNGASTAIRSCLKLLCNKIGCQDTGERCDCSCEKSKKCNVPRAEKNTGVLIPVPQYPLYLASIVEYGLDAVEYYLDEEHNWGMDIQELERAFSEADCAVRAIVVINPGNPTGQVLSRGNIEDVIKFAYKHNLLLLADEVYQDNVYTENCKFHSFKKVLRELGHPFEGIELASFMSISKGFVGECGLRGGWVELVNMDPQVQAQMYKCISTTLCPNVSGQIAIDCVAQPPKPGEPSYVLFVVEKTEILEAHKYRAQLLVETFHEMTGCRCNELQGATYAFPNIRLPPKALDAAKKLGQSPDVFYAFKLLEETGICIDPGSGFGQRSGTYHFRTTILPQLGLLTEMVVTLKQFHLKFTQDFS